MEGFTRKQFSLVLVLRDDKVLLGYKKRDFGQGRWNTFGGKLEENETAEEAAIRELQEESGLEATSTEKVGEIEFTMHGDGKIMDMTIFIVRCYNGLPVETEEMRPCWFPLSNIPFGDMWPDAKLWYPIVLRGDKFKGVFHYEDHDVIRFYKLEEIAS